jgi:hypothetical protein
MAVPAKHIPELVAHLDVEEKRSVSEPKRSPFTGRP